MQRCAACNTYVFPPEPNCTTCLSAELAWVESAGRGADHTYSVVWRPQQPSFVVPYAPAIVDMEVIDSIKSRRIEVVKGVESLDAQGVQLAGGSRVEPHVVICATGYNRSLEPLVGHLGVLDERGLPRALAQKAAAPGLRFVGYVPRPGGLGYMGKEGRRAAKAIAGEVTGAD